MSKNEEIIEKKRIELVNKGLIEENDDLHTKDYWKKRGFKIKDGEKPIDKALLWVKVGEKIIHKWTSLYATEQTDYKEKLSI